MNLSLVKKYIIIYMGEIMFRPLKDYVELGILISIPILFWIGIIFLIKYIITT